MFAAASFANFLIFYYIISVWLWHNGYENTWNNVKTLSVYKVLLLLLTMLENIVFFPRDTKEPCLCPLPLTHLLKQFVFTWSACLKLRIFETYSYWPGSSVIVPRDRLFVKLNKGKTDVKSMTYKEHNGFYFQPLL